MNFLLEVHRSEKEVVVKNYPTACACCDAVMKARKYFEDLMENVTMKMKDNEGRLYHEEKVYEEVTKNQ